MRWLGVLVIAGGAWASIGAPAKWGRGNPGAEVQNEEPGGPKFVTSGQVTFVKTLVTTQRSEVWFLAPNHHAATDMDNDGDIDIVFTALDNEEPWWGQVYIAYNDSIGNDGFPVFHTVAVSPEVRTPYALDVDDQNGDGLKDILFAAARYREEDNWDDTDYYGHPFWLMAPSWNMVDLGEYDFPNHCAAWDFDGDGLLDAVFGDERDAVYVHLTASGQTIKVMDGYGEGVALGDFNEDGQMDVVSAGWGPVAVAINQGGGANWSVSQVSSAAAHGVQVGDVNGDGHLDIVGCYGSVYLLLGNGAGGFSQVTVYSGFAWIDQDWGLSEAEVGIADIDGDGDNDIIVSTRKPNVHTIAWFENLGGNPPSFTMWPVESGTANTAYGVEVRDVNRDGCVDIVAGINNGLYVWYNVDCATGTPERPGEAPPLLAFRGQHSGGLLHISATRPAEAEVKVYNSMGALVAKARLSGQALSLPLSLKDGVYLLKLTTSEGKVFAGKFLAEAGTFELKQINRGREEE